MMLDLPPDWAELIGWLAANSWQRLVVLGGADMGKSSFCRLLCRQIGSQQRRVVLVDADLGQKMVGPPACVSLGRCMAGGSLELERFRFIGEVSPAANIAGVVAATARLAAVAAADRLIVNTSGLTTGPGLPLKRWKLEALNCDQMVAIAPGDELTTLIAPLPPGRLHRLLPSPAAQRKSPATRERNRRTSLMAALGDCRPRSLPGLVIEDLHRAPPMADAFRLCGLADAAGEDSALGLVRWSDYLSRKELWTGPIGFEPHRVRLGMDLAHFGEMLYPFLQGQV